MDDPGVEVSQRMSGNLVLPVHLVAWMMDMLCLADSFPAQKSQDCIVVGGGNHIQKL